MKKIHIVIPDLFLPQQLASYAGADLALPALEKLLARGKVNPLTVETLEEWLCEKFGVETLALAPITLIADGIEPQDAYWLRADPVGINMQRDQMLLQTDLSITALEAQRLCASLNDHFQIDGLKFVSPHPQRWYLKLDQAPAMQTHPLPQVVGSNMNVHLPQGEESLRWHSVLNEIQMLFYGHEVNQAREERGELPINGLWLWGGGKHVKNYLQPYVKIVGDGELAQAFAQAADISYENIAVSMQDKWFKESGDSLLVWEGLRSALQNANIEKWRNSLLKLENDYMAPLLLALAKGHVEQITLDILSEGRSQRFVVNRVELWKLWRKTQPLLTYGFA